VSRQSIKLVALLISSALLTSSCAAGFDAATNQQKASGNGRSANVDAIQVRGALIVIDPKNPGWGTFVGTIINTAADQDEFLAVDLDQASGTSSRTREVLNTQEPVQFGLPGQFSLPLQLTAEVKAGTLVNVLLEFKNNEAIPMSLFVENNDGIYADIVIMPTTFN